MSNEESVLWHGAFGFGEEPDTCVARLRRAFHAHEVSRREGLQTARARRKHARLGSLYAFWSRRAERLERLVEGEGFEAATPALGCGWRG